MRVLIIDNYDSFTFNLYQYVGEILLENATSSPDDIAPPSHSIRVARNDEISLEEIKQFAPDRIIISPGPGSPDDPAYFGICREVIRQFGQTTPLLGVCLGMQGIASSFGGKVVKASVPMHGKTSPIRHNNSGVFNGLPQDLEIMRYHSLMVEQASLPDCLHITAITSAPLDPTNTLDPETGNLADILEQTGNTGEIMGIRHNHYPIEGLQFHPESFATEGAKNLLRNFILQR